MRLLPDNSITDACRTQEEAIAKQQGHCPMCDLTGVLTIFHRNYTGSPTMTITDHNGKQREVRARVSAHCNCEVGKWARSCNTPEVRKRIPLLHDILTGLMPHWSPIDPTEPEFNADQELDWKAFRELLASAPSGIRSVSSDRRPRPRLSPENPFIGQPVPKPQPVPAMAQREPGED